MKLASYLKHKDALFGVVKDDGLLTLTGKLGSIRTLKDALAADALPRIADLAARTPADTAFADVQYLPPLPDPGKLLCIGLNYRAHMEEMDAAVAGEKPVPTFFVRTNHALIAHGQPMLRPRVSEQLDFEGELAVIIGKPARHVDVDAAMAHVAGYTCFVDGSVRDFQKQSTGAGKNFEATAPFGPYLVTADEVGDPANLTLTSRLNGEIMQQSGLNLMIHSVAQCISYISQIMWLQPGDVIATGSPSGTGAARRPPLWLKHGDHLELTIDRVGTLSTPIRDE